MKTLLEYIHNNKAYKSYKLFNETIGTITFELDESSLDLLSDEFKSMICEMSKYPEKTSNKQKNYRIIWVSRDKDNLRLTTHGEDRLDRPTEKGGDGEHIEESEIKNMFIYAWSDIMDMYYEGYLNKDNYGNNRWVIQCKCYLSGSENNLYADGARPENKYLWAVFNVKENYNTGKIDVTIVTLFRGERLNHTSRQERIVIANNGYVKQKIPR